MPDFYLMSELIKDEKHFIRNRIQIHSYMIVVAGLNCQVRKFIFVNYFIIILVLLHKRSTCFIKSLEILFFRLSEKLMDMVNFLK